MKRYGFHSRWKLSGTIVVGVLGLFTMMRIPPIFSYRISRISQCNSRGNAISGLTLSGLKHSTNKNGYISHFLYQQTRKLHPRTGAAIRLYSSKNADEVKVDENKASNLVYDDNEHDKNWSHFPVHVQEFLSAFEEALCGEILPELDKAPLQGEEVTERPMMFLLGVSGGCDSMGLLHALLDSSIVVESEVDGNNSYSQLRQLRNGQTFELHVVHFDHRQRGTESDKDRLLVQRVCNEQGIPCHTYTWEHEDAASFSQDKARQWRKSTMAQLLEQLTKPEDDEAIKLGLILTAHHANDSQETLLLKLIRGVHVQNLSGMSQVQQMDDSTTWARPFLGLTKDQIQEYLISQDYAWREDASNQSNKYLRNRVRNELIPLMRELVGGDAALQRRLANLDEQCRDIRSDLSGRVEPLLAEHLDAENRFLLSSDICLEHDVVARQSLYNWANKATGKHQISYDLWKTVLAQIREYPNNREWTLPLGGDWHITRTGEALQVVDDRSENIQTPFQGENAFSFDYEHAENLTWYFMDDADTPMDPAVLVVWPDPTYISSANGITFLKSTAGHGETNINSWRFTPPWRAGRSPLKLGTFLRGQKVPLHLRESIPIIYCRENNETETKLHLVAVQVGDHWIFDAAWAEKVGESSAGHSTIAINLR